MSMRILLAVLMFSVTMLAAQAVVTYQRIVVADTVVGLATTTLDPTGEGQIRQCEGRLEEGQIRYVIDAGTTVGSTTGVLLEVGDILTLSNHGAAAALRMAKTGSTTGVFMVQCWR